MKIKGINVEIQKGWYNKTKLQPDRKTHIIDTSKQYPIYELAIRKCYYDIESKEEVVEEVITDLEEVIEQLKRIKQKGREEER